MTVIEKAKAKINLTLHVGAPLSAGVHKGYHPLESLVIFADIGDEISVQASDHFSLEIKGPFAGQLEADEDNLILKAARLAAREYSLRPCAFVLTKVLPVASGMGGGSADAAATLRAMARLNDLPVQAFADLAMEIGADVPVCMRSQTSLMSGVGEVLTPLKSTQGGAAVLVNPGFAVSTADVFSQFDRALTPQHKLFRHDLELVENDLLSRAKAGRNDLEPMACEIKPDIETVLAHLSQIEGAVLTRMSGSGASCFSIFETQAQAQDAAQTLQNMFPQWWVCETYLGQKTSEKPLT